MRCGRNSGWGSGACGFHPVRQGRAIIRVSPRPRPLIGRYAPASLVIAPGGKLAELAPALARPVSGTVNAWVCRGVVCLAPLDDPERVLVEIGAVA